MKLSTQGHFRRAIQLAFAVGVAGAGAPVQAADQPSTQQLQGVEVTGSRIRRVDAETSNLVQVLDRKQIEATGAATLGELIQAIPSMSGISLNSVANNQQASFTGGGGTYGGSSTIDLRGIGPNRTLVLIDGQRDNIKDPDAIPANMIERVEVLKEGAGPIYGSDAIAGVINFITRKNFSGLEVTALYGKTQRNDGAATGASITWGATSSRSSAVFGLNYNRQDEITATSREATALPASIYGGVVLPMGFSSSRAPNGKFTVPGFTPLANPLDAACPFQQFSGVTLIAGRDGTSSNDYRNFCNNFGSGFTDRFNYQPYNLDLDPTRRLSVFGTGTFKLTDDIKWYGQGYFTHNTAVQKLAPEPFDNVTIQGNFPTLPASAINISDQNIYNPFAVGVPITSFGKRGVQVGQRIFTYLNDQYQFATGFKGTVLDRFEWDAAVNYGQFDQSALHKGYSDFSKLLQQFGPSYYADPITGAAIPQPSPGAVVPGAVPTCGTPGNPIPNCTPINIFGTAGTTLAGLAATILNTTVQSELDATFNVDGDIFNLPAGAVGLAAGAEFRNLHYEFEPDGLQEQFSASEANQKPTNGAYDVRGVYAETHVPVIKDFPLIKSLDLNLGVRYENYSSFGSNTSAKYAFEWRPYSDLLLRGTYSDVYRAPNTTELYAGAAQTAASQTGDPCLGLSATALAAKPIACAGVPVQAGQTNTQGNAVTLGNPNLKPEKGFSTDLGLVFNPSFYKPLSFTLDVWRYSLKDAISSITLNQVLQSCFANESSAFCGNAPDGNPYFVRSNNAANATTDIANGELPSLNAFNLLVNGVDGSVKLSYPNTHVAGYGLGSFDLGIDVTYMDRFEIRQIDPSTGAVTLSSEAGLLDTNTFVSIPRFRGLGYLFWSKGPFGASVEDRYIGNLRGTRIDGLTQADRSTGYANYIDVAGTYTMKQLNTSVTVGVNDLFDDGIQRTYDGVTAGAPLSIYDVRGRNFYGKVTWRFK